MSTRCADEVQSATSGSDQHQLARWTERTLSEFRADQKDLQAQLEQRAPAGTRVLPVLADKRLLAVIAARGFRARDSEERQSIMMGAVADLLAIVLTPPAGQTDSRVCDATVTALGVGLASTRSRFGRRSHLSSRGPRLSRGALGFPALAS